MPFKKLRLMKEDENGKEKGTTLMNPPPPPSPLPPPLPPTPPAKDNCFSGGDDNASFHLEFDLGSEIEAKSSQLPFPSTVNQSGSSGSLIGSQNPQSSCVFNEVKVDFGIWKSEGNFKVELIREGILFEKVVVDEKSKKIHFFMTKNDISGAWYASTYHLGLLCFRFGFRSSQHIEKVLDVKNCLIRPAPATIYEVPRYVVVKLSLNDFHLLQKYIYKHKLFDFSIKLIEYEKAERCIARDLVFGTQNYDRKESIIRSFNFEETRSIIAQMEKESSTMNYYSLIINNTEVQFGTFKATEIMVKLNRESIEFIGVPYGVGPQFVCNIKLLLNVDITPPMYYAKKGDGNGYLVVRPGIRVSQEIETYIRLENFLMREISGFAYDEPRFILIRLTRANVDTLEICMALRACKCPELIEDLKMLGKMIQNDISFGHHKREPSKRERSLSNVSQVSQNSHVTVSSGSSYNDNDSSNQILVRFTIDGSFWEPTELYYKDIECLNEEEYIVDVIADFYLRYLWSNLEDELFSSKVYISAAIFFHILDETLDKRDEKWLCHLKRINIFLPPS